MVNKLQTYHEKRDFTRTSEPSGGDVAQSDRARFVIQKHDARQLHYDLRLELDGVFKSWAVTRGPSLNPADKRLAVEVEDHPLAYGDFEGTIPRGEYGGGTVMLWDRGYWQCDDPLGGLARGDLKFTLDGEKLHGSWVLVRMKHDRNGGKRTNWLLIKHRDADASESDDVLARDTSVASGRTMDAIAEGRRPAPKPFMLAKARLSPAAVWDTRSGIAADARKVARTKPSVRLMAKSSRTAVRRAPVMAEPMPQFIPPELCASVDKPPAGAGWVHEIKLDGYRMQLRVEGGVATLQTRSGLDWTDKMRSIAAVAADLLDCMIDGELVVLDEHGVSQFSDLQDELANETGDRLTFYAFDLLFAEGRDVRTLPLIERKAKLAKLLDQAGFREYDAIRFLTHLETGGAALLASAGELSLEGIISKRADAQYKSGRSGDWVKSKVRGGQEVVLGGWRSNGSAFRSLLAGVYRGDQLVYVGLIGTGFPRSTVTALMPELKAAASDVTPFAGPGAPKPARDIHWLKPELVAEIEFAGFTGDGKIRQAAFKALRRDKPAAEIRQEVTPMPSTDFVPVRKTTATKRTSSHASPARSKRGKVEVLGVTLSNPDKVFWPAVGEASAVTKLDLAHYLEAVGDLMLPHIQGRPVSIVRAPDGITGEQFFQRHAMPGMSGLLAEVLVSDDCKPYVQVDRVDALIAIAQIGGLELHPWNCAPDRPDRPGRLVFDLDPAPDVPFDEVIVAAKELRQRLEKLGLTPFCKTTGGKGLHLVTPLSIDADVALDWSVAKTFAQAVCQQMADDSPDRYLLNMAKNRRVGRIFLDYLRNDRKSTAVAVLSPRARAGATVSMPLTWAQLGRGLDPRKYTIASVPDLLKRTSAWSDYHEAAIPLKAAVERFTAAAGECFPRGSE